MGVGDLAGAMVELELLEGRERAVAVLDEAKALPLVLARLDEAIVACARFTKERAGDEDDADDGEESGQDERDELHL
jgi:hypothetical protein